MPWNRSVQLGLKLGSDPFAHGALALDKYVDTAPVVPDTVAVPAGGTFPFGMLDNDTYGDCVPAALYHADESLYLRKGVTPYPYQAPECLALYFAVNGVQPGPAGSGSDQGTDPSTAMAWWVKEGLPGHNLAGFGQLPATSPNLRRAIWEFGVVILAIALPDNWQSFVNSAGVANFSGTVTPDQNNGHGICANGYTPDLFNIVTWGEEGTSDNAFTASVLEQVFVPLSTDALNSADVGPSGFGLAQMKSDLGTLA
jgi:hypothetical protein